VPLASAHACSTSASARRVASAAVVGRLYLLCHHQHLP